MSEFHIIENIGLGEGKTMSETAKALKITSGTLTTGIDNLVKKGYVFRKRSTEDRRKVLIKLTEKGVKAYNAHYEFHEEMVADTLQQIPRDEEEVLIRALFNVDKYFKKKYKL
jgi:DNA-binding MarR family transcriptional regulator